MSRERSARCKKLLTAFMIVAGCALLPLLGLLIYDSLGAADLAKAMQEARRMGGPVTLQELMDARKNWPDDRNAADVILEIRPALEELRRALDAKNSDLARTLPILGNVEYAELGRRWTDETVADISDFLDRMKPELDALDSLRNYEGGAFHLIVPPNPLDMDFSHLGSVRLSARLVALRLIHSSLHDDTAGFVEDVRLMLQLRALIADEPNMMSSLVGVSCESMTGFMVEQVLAVSHPDARTLAGVQALMSHNEPFPRMNGAVRAERANFIAITDWLRATGSSTGWMSSKLPGTFRMGPGLYGRLMREEARGVELYRRLIRQTDPLGLMNEYAAVGRELAAQPMGPLDGAFGAMTRAMLLHIRTAAEVRCTEVGLAAERFRLEHGSWPEDLKELVPRYIREIPEDPFAPGRPVKRACRDARLIVYSVGRDRQDDGGVVVRGRADDSELDVGFIVLDPHLRNLPPLRQLPVVASRPGR